MYSMMEVREVHACMYTVFLDAAGISKQWVCHLYDARYTRTRSIP